jgi:predicted nucleotidyltransferase
MNIDIMLSTKERIKVLSHIIYKSDCISVNRVAKDVKLSKGLVSKYLDSLTKEGILKRAGTKFLVKDNIQTKAIKILLSLNKIDSHIFKKYRFVKSAGLYGSLTKGINTESSDTDLWLFIENTKEYNLARLTAELKKHFGNVRPLYLTKEKIKILKKEDTTFYHSLIFGSIVIYGDGIEAV